MNLKQKRILVTGASSGIGRSAAKIFSQLGAELVLIAKDRKRLDETLNELDGKNHQSYCFDLSQCDEIPSFLKEITKNNKLLSGIFHAAGIVLVKPVNVLKSKHVDEIFNPSIKAAILLTRGFCQKGVRVEDWGSIVLMSSATSIAGQSGLSLYSASKGAIDSAVRSLACELVHRKIRINSIVAGAIETPMLEHSVDQMSEENLKSYRAQHLLGFGQPEDIAHSAAFLISDASKWITGSRMVVDGGFSCH